MRTCIAMLSAALALAVAPGCSREKIPSPQTADKVVVVASIFPIANLAKQIGGEFVEVHCLLDPGVSPHGFSARPAHVETLSKARLLLMVGSGLDEWARKAAEAARDGNPGLRVVELTRHPDFLRAEAKAPRGEESGERPAGPTAPATASAPGVSGPGHTNDPPAAEHRHEHGGTDPHVWLDPVLMQALTLAVVEELAKVDPTHDDQYVKAGIAFANQLVTLDGEYRSTLDPARVKTRHFLTYHEAFGHLARRYGLVQIAVDEIGQGTIGTGRLEEVLKFVKDHDVRAIFVEPQYPAEKLEALARQTHARVGRLDPEGNPNVPGYDSYLSMMRSNLRELARGLGAGD